MGKIIKLKPNEPASCVFVQMSRPLEDWKPIIVAERKKEYDKNWYTRAKQENPEKMKQYNARNVERKRVRKATDPDFREMVKQQSAKYYARWKYGPSRAKELHRQATYRSIVRNDPVRYDALRARQKKSNAVRKECECGAIVCQGAMFAHKKSAKHLKAMDLIN